MYINVVNRELKEEPMLIRKLKQSEVEASLQMSEFAFQFEMSDKDRIQAIKSAQPEQTWVIEEQDEIVSKATVLPLHVYLNGQVVPIGGVSGVVTWPEHRRGGHVTKLLEHSLIEMKEEGQVLAFLYPFSIPFYRKYGWELFADTETLTLEKDQLPKREKYEGTIRRMTKEDPLIVDDVYQAWAKQFSGTIVRDSKWWERSVFKRKKGSIVAYFNSQKEKTGYLIYEVKNRKMTVHEIIWLVPDARRALFHFISNHDSMIDKVVIKTVAHDRLPFLLTDPQVKREVTSYFMARIVDVKAFLSLYPFEFNVDDQPLILHISDEFCSWNSGTYIVSHSDSNQNKIEVRFFAANVAGEGAPTRATCAHPPKKGIHLSVQHLAAILFCTQSTQVLLEEEFIKGDQQSMVIFESALPHLKPFIYDFF